MSEHMGFSKMFLGHQNMWFGQIKNERVGDKEPLIPG